MDSSTSLYFANSFFVLVGACLVFIMHIGFSCVEVGMCRSKNAANIAMKNVMTVAIGVVVYFLVGYGFMFGQDAGHFIGLSNFCLAGISPSSVMEGAGVNNYIYFFWEGIFCATCATIVSGAMAERTNFFAYLFFCAVAASVIYPIMGHWIWTSDGWLSLLGCHDYAGGLIVHALGGTCALVGAKMVGPRIGKYNKDGSPNAIPGHNLIYATIGVLLLFFGWFGFNGASSLDITADATYISEVSTFIGGAVGGLTAALLTLALYHKVDPGMVLNGILAGLVGVTPGADVFSPMASLIVGILAAGAMTFAVPFVDEKLKIDDPVGALSVHGVGGITGTLCVGLFSMENGLFYGGGIHQLLMQVLGLVVILPIGAALTYVTFRIAGVLFHGIRVEAEDEIIGLDECEHGMNAYGD
ncbi:MAG: ammonium transporter [Oscillospiraceae bacterium]|nr:ammonium transporter [Oscillospiraceae bacterium]